jgi:hypothetical protein
MTTELTLCREEVNELENIVLICLLTFLRGALLKKLNSSAWSFISKNMNNLFPLALMLKMRTTWH